MSRTKRNALVALASACALAVIPGTARAWNAGTHAWIAADLNKELGLTDPADLAARIYGANALDLFNNDFTQPDLTLQALLHDPSGNLFLNVWSAADPEDPAEVAFAYGVVTHNNSWGADSTAHVSGITYGRGVGWVIAKAMVFAVGLDSDLQANGIILTEAQLVDVGHILVEQAVDLLMLEVDPTLGTLLMQSAASRDARFADVLVAAWADAFAEVVGTRAAAEAEIRAKEAMLKDFLMAYGWALTQEDALFLVSEQIGTMAEGYLGLPPGSGEALVPLIEYEIGEAMKLCAPDFRREIFATTGWVNGRMSSNGVAF